jgi:hypothetical protein
MDACFTKRKGAQEIRRSKNQDKRSDDSPVVVGDPASWVNRAENISKEGSLPLVS